MFHCAIFEFDTGVILIWLKQELLPRELSCFFLICDNTFLLPSLFQNSQTCVCVLRWIREQILLKATCLSCGHFFYFPVISVPSSHLLHSCMNIHADTAQKVGRWERRNCGISHSLRENMTGAATLTHRYSAGDAGLELCSKPSLQNGEECGAWCKQPPLPPGCPPIYLFY